MKCALRFSRIVVFVALIRLVSSAAASVSFSASASDELFSTFHTWSLCSQTLFRHVFLSKLFFFAIFDSFRLEPILIKSTPLPDFILVKVIVMLLLPSKSCVVLSFSAMSGNIVTIIF